MDPLGKITALPRKAPAAERVAMQLQELIRSGSLKAGDKLPSENELGAALQVSRPVVREALRGLQLLGLLETRQGGRCYVTDLNVSRLLAPLHFVIGLDETNVDRLFEARILVECEVIRLGVPHLAAETRTKLQGLAEAGLTLTGDPIGFRVLDLEFHETLMRLAGNPFLEVVARSLYELGMEYRRVASETPGVIQRSAAEHAVIVGELIRGDTEATVAALRGHIRSIYTTTLEAMRRGEATVAETEHEAAQLPDGTGLEARS